jgi:hypothetical protein
MTASSNPMAGVDFVWFVVIVNTTCRHAVNLYFAEISMIRSVAGDSCATNLDAISYTSIMSSVFLPDENF